MVYYQTDVGYHMEVFLVNRIDVSEFGYILPMFENKLERQKELMLKKYQKQEKKTSQKIDDRLRVAQNKYQTALDKENEMLKNSDNIKSSTKLVKNNKIVYAVEPIIESDREDNDYVADVRTNK